MAIALILFLLVALIWGIKTALMVAGAVALVLLALNELFSAIIAGKINF